MPARVIVFERDGEWSRAIRRYLTIPVCVLEVLPIQRTQAGSPSAPVEVFVVEPDTDAHIVNDWVRTPPFRRERQLKFAILRPADQALAWLLRELGVSWVWDEFWQVPRMVHWIEQFCRRLPPPDLSLEARIWNNLPWAEVNSESWKQSGSTE
jgi:hypothetical protein